MPTSNTEELGRFLKCTVIGRGVFGPCACCKGFGIRVFLQFEIQERKIQEIEGWI